MRERQVSSLARAWRVEKRALTAVGLRGVLMTSKSPNPAAVLAGVGDAADGNDVGGVAHVELARPGQLAHGLEGGRHLLIEPSQDLFLGPEVVHVALDLLEVAAGDPAGVGQERGEDEDAAALEDRVGLRRRRAVGAFGP